MNLKNMPIDSNKNKNKCSCIKTNTITAAKTVPPTLNTSSINPIKIIFYNNNTNYNNNNNNYYYSSSNNSNNNLLTKTCNYIKILQYFYFYILIQYLPHQPKIPVLRPRIHQNPAKTTTRIPSSHSEIDLQSPHQKGPRPAKKIHLSSHVHPKAKIPSKNRLHQRPLANKENGKQFYH